MDGNRLSAKGGKTDKEGIKVSVFKLNTGETGKLFRNIHSGKTVYIGVS